MGLNQTREVKTTYLCDFCKHEAVFVAEYERYDFPKGWSMLAIVPAEEKPYFESMPSSFQFEGTRYCLSSNKKIDHAIACPTCSVQGLQVIKTAKPEAPAISYAFKLTTKVFYLLVGALISVGTIFGIALGFLLKR